jgi:hypothetical protein
MLSLLVTGLPNSWPQAPHVFKAFRKVAVRINSFDFRPLPLEIGYDRFHQCDIARIVLKRFPPRIMVFYKVSTPTGVDGPLKPVERGIDVAEQQRILRIQKQVGAAMQEATVIKCCVSLVDRLKYA